MTIKTLVTIFLLSILVMACAPVPTDAVQQPSAESAEASDATAEAADDHADDDAGEHDAEESEHSDEDAEEHGHDEEHGDAEEHGDEDQRREHGAHEHGVAEMTIAWSGNEMAIDLQTPAFNVLGFEYAPTTDAEKALLEQSIAALEAGNLLQIDPDADCAVTSAIVETTMAEELHAEETDTEELGDHASEEHDEEIHSDIDVAYNLVCQQPDNIGSLDASALFAQFPNLEEIQVQWISDTQQSAAAISPVNPVILFN